MSPGAPRAGAVSPKLPAKGGGSKGGAAAAAAGGKGSSSGSNVLQAYSHQATLTQLFCDVHKQLAMGTVRVLLTLPLLGMWQPPALLFNSQAQRYDQRFASFLVLQRPDPLMYEQFVASTDVSGASAEVLLRLAQENFAKVGLLFCGFVILWGWRRVVCVCGRGGKIREGCTAACVV